MTKTKFKIEQPGDYRTRHGHKAQVIAENPTANAYSRWIGWVGDAASAWNSEGWRADSINPDDIVDVWKDPVEWDWSSTPPWFHYIAKDRTGGKWHLYSEEPVWYSDGQWRSEGHFIPIPGKFAPGWAGSDCSKSCASRPIPAKS